MADPETYELIGSHFKLARDMWRIVSDIARDIRSELPDIRVSIHIRKSLGKHGNIVFHHTRGRAVRIRILDAGTRNILDSGARQHLIDRIDHLTRRYNNMRGYRRRNLHIADFDVATEMDPRAFSVFQERFATPGPASDRPD